MQKYIMFFYNMCTKDRYEFRYVLFIINIVKNRAETYEKQYLLSLLLIMSLSMITTLSVKHKLNKKLIYCDSFYEGIILKLYPFLNMDLIAVISTIQSSFFTRYVISSSLHKNIYVDFSLRTRCMMKTRGGMLCYL